MTDTAALDRLLEHISAGVYGTPVRAMEEVLAIGAPAIPRLTDALASWRDDEGKGYAAMFAAVLLGEMRHPDALPALIEELKRPDFGAVTEVAADGLAKLGAAAVPPLIELARTGGERERLAAYLALGPMREERVYALLMDALVRDGHLADVVALALADQGRAEAMPAIEAAYRRAEPWQRLEFESALLRLHDGIARGTGARSDWRLRYRRWDEDGEQFDRYGFGSLALVHADEALQHARPLLPLRPLEEILAEPEEPEEQTTCPDCGRPLQPYTGLRACPDTAVATAVLQLEVLEAAEDDDVEDIFELLDEIEEDERGRFSALPPRGPRARQRWFEERDELRMCWDTCAWLVERGVGTVSEGISRLSDEARRLASRFGDPRRLLSPPAPVRLAGPKVGRNDPCPCGSGRKYKNCCLAKA